MAMNLRGGGVFAVGLLLGAVGAAVLVGQAGEDDSPASATAAGGGNIALVAANAPRVDCSFAPMVPAAGREDGTLRLDKDLQAGSSGAVSALILSGKEAAASGKVRDAEIAFLMACRSGEMLKSDPIPLADAQYQLGRHYAQLATSAEGAKRTELLRRAEGLYAHSVQAFRKHRGPEHEKTRFALQGLASLQQLKGGAAPAVAAAPAPATAPAPAPAPSAGDHTKIAGAGPLPTPAPSIPVMQPDAAPQAAAPAKPEAAVAKPGAEVAKPETKPEARLAEPKPAAAQPTTQVAAAPATSPAPAPQARRSSPSFDCARARSTTEKLICEDEDLARQDRELGRIHQRAKQAASDPRAFQRDSDAEWARREATCTDRDCLQRWYAQRRAQLSAAATEKPAAPAAARSTPRVVERDAAPERATREPERTVREPERVVRAPAPVREAPAVREPAPAPREPVVEAVRPAPAAPTEVITEPPATAAGSASAPTTDTE